MFYPYDQPKYDQSEYDQPPVAEEEYNPEADGRLVWDPWVIVGCLLALGLLLSFLRS